MIVALNVSVINVILAVHVSVIVILAVHVSLFM